MNILQMLQGSEPALLTALTEVWGVRLDPRADVARMVDGLFKAMTDPARAEAVWDILDDKARGALQMLIGSSGAMPEAKFVRVFGEIRRMGEGKIRSEQPHKQPASAAEALFYRGLITFSFDTTDGPRSLVVVPADLLDVLPLTKTGYSKLKDEEVEEYVEEEGGESAALEPIDPSRVKNTRQADTSLVDDLTTLLAYLRIHTPLLDGDRLAAADLNKLSKHLLTQGEQRMRFLLGLGVSADLIEIANGKATPSRTGAPRWLGKSRHDQVQALAEAWRNSSILYDLLYVPGLNVEINAGSFAQYSPAAAREGLLEIMMHTLPPNGWWQLSDFVELVREDSADFLRPSNDFDSWYISDDDGTMLTGLDHWDDVEGALIEYTLIGLMHWLGLIDLGEDAARLTAYGRGFLKMAAYPSGADAVDPIDVGADGVVKVSRKVSRADRYQVARFSSWVSASANGYVYKLDRAGLGQAESQGINAGHISGFIKRALGDKPLPDAIARLLEPRTAGEAAAHNATVTVEKVLVLRTTAPETLDFIVNEPRLRRFTGARLGDMAVIVLKSANLEEFANALAEHGIGAEFIGG
ncbi:MAG: hypothetical protein IPK19_28610 [Chloroflexi bacterium]|nr:hypothetical protein [Chloroflexota bacterium]